jgi:hypothetical protein
MSRKILVFVVLLLALDFSASFAQRRSGSGSTSIQSHDHRLELHVFGGYAFTFSRRVCSPCGDLDIKDSGFWAIAADINVQPFTQLELLYNRQDSKLIFRPDPGGIRREADIAVEYWHIGGLRGIPQGNLMPFGSLTLGATRYNLKDSTFSDEWKFSMILGVGAKFYPNDRLGVRVQARLPFTFTSTYLGFGPGGAMVGGTGIAQFDLSGGLFLMF